MKDLVKVSRSEVKEKVQLNEAIKEGKRTEKDMSQKERELFKLNYPYVSNDILAKQFLISTEDVERLAHELKVYKNPDYTRTVMGKSHEGDTPGHLIEAITKKLTEEERREIISLKNEGIDEIAMMEELILVQRVRIQRGAQIEAAKGGLYRVVNDAVDSAGILLFKLREMRHGTKHQHNVTLDQMILDSQGKADD
jgi:hypothetical protein